MKIYYDTSVTVAFCVKGHPHHAAALNAIEQVATKRHKGYMSAHGLVETFSVLTRTPFSPPVYSNEAWQVIEESILPHLTLVTLSADEHRQVLKECAERGWSGGRIYDVLHLKCAAKVGCDRVQTFNVRHFRELAPASLESRICCP